MAGIAFRSGGNVVRVLTGGENAVVTSRADADGLKMTELLDEAPVVDVVTVLADVRRRQVIGRFAASRNAIMAVETPGHDSGMVERPDG